MKSIVIDNRKHGRFECLLDNEDYDFISSHRWRIGKCATKFYPQTHDNKEYSRMHRLIMSRYHDLNNKIIDHKDGNTLNNRKNNLRICSVSENGMNQKIQSRNKTAEWMVC